MSFPLASYLAVGGVGGFAGLVVTFFIPGGMDNLIPPKLRSRISDESGWSIAYAAVTNIICGALASTIGWLAYGSGTDATSTGGGPVTGRVVLGSIILGLTGTSVLKSIITTRNKDTTIGTLNTSVDTLGAQVEQLMQAQQNAPEANPAQGQQPKEEQEP